MPHSVLEAVTGGLEFRGSKRVAEGSGDDDGLLVRLSRGSGVSFIFR